MEPGSIFDCVAGLAVGSLVYAPADQTGARVDCFPVRAAFPKWQEGRHPHCHFRDAMDVRQSDRSSVPVPNQRSIAMATSAGSAVAAVAAHHHVVRINVLRKIAAPHFKRKAVVNALADCENLSCSRAQFSIGVFHFA